ncbi:tributyrin esterase [Staphylococcus condimenti]|uniref:Alpha/beta hydrolase n=1 Tax=Staphylococcus condimenti TaxID=70255 RepID=A0A143PDF0_9STAP|nr:MULTISPECIES: alpha/beta hydrolase family protein [Staphylococcus]AMY06330.1 tributyrin esterase [Staphylococcus condimenti]APR60213.1 tributyrin esterase [Staphylococcus condimenti]MDK8644331.1 alpha/beta hydrolase family protein [Staphylococcus condimenti]NAM82372.1 esterase family protein [Staphylococcus epidermidis]OFP00174.1 tributyrin esterase [Staphylococcus sp. HMSC065E08]
MAWMQVNYNSEVLGKEQRFMAMLPEDPSQFQTDKSPKQLPVLLLLHGLSSDETSYLRFTSLERYAKDNGIAVIMPAGDHSGYANMAYGHSYYDYVLEVFDYALQILPLSKRREDHFIAGHSMGGYGTIKYALSQGDRFSKAAPLSAVFAPQFLMEIDWNDFSGKAILGEKESAEGTILDPYYLVDQALEEDKTIPELLIMCGTEDDLYQDNLDFIHFLDEKKVPYQFVDGPGIHDYAYWDKAIKYALEWFAGKEHN